VLEYFLAAPEAEGSGRARRGGFLVSPIHTIGVTMLSASYIKNAIR
jgi:hypothetical protein